MIIEQYTASWCAPCRQMAPTIDAVVSKFALELRKIDIDANPQAVQKRGVQSIPCLIIFDDSGKELARTVGVQTKPSLEKLVSGLVS